MAKKEELQKYYDEYDEAKKHFLFFYKPEFDRAYKLFVSYTGDRAKELERMAEDGRIWQSNVFVPQVFSYIKTFLQKIVGVTPDFKLEGVHQDALKEVVEWLWEIGMSEDQIDYFLQLLICGNTIGKDFLKKDAVKEREKELSVIEQVIEGIRQFYKKLVRKTKGKGFVFRPDWDAVDLYDFYPHPRMKKMSDPLPVFQRYVLTLDEAKLQYPDVPESVWRQFLNEKGEVIKDSGDITDYAYVRKEVLLEAVKSLREYTKESTVTGAVSSVSPSVAGLSNSPQTKEKLFEIVERWTDDKLVVFLPQSGSPIELKDGDNPNDHGEKPYRKVGLFPRPFQFYWMGIPKLLEKLQDLLNSITNQRVDAVTLGIHGMIAAAPVSIPGYKGSTFQIGPMRILWTNDPRSVVPIKLGDVNQSAFLEPDQIKEAMRVAVGIDEFSTVKGTDRKETATVASFLREATLEGVKMFLIMLRFAYVGHFDHFVKLIQQYWTKRSVVPKKALAILDDYSDVDFPVKDEQWIGEDGKHRLFPDEYEISVEQASTLATSTELRKSKDLELWDMIKDLPDLVDEESGKVYTVRKFKVLMNIIKDYGWEKDQYVVEKKQEVAPAVPPEVMPGSMPGAHFMESKPTPPLPGQGAGAELSKAIQP
jgi:hypothetical protein